MSIRSGLKPLLVSNCKKMKRWLIVADSHGAISVAS